MSDQSQSQAQRITKGDRVKAKVTRAHFSAGYIGVCINVATLQGIVYLSVRLPSGKIVSPTNADDWELDLQRDDSPDPMGRVSASAAEANARRAATDNPVFPAPGRSTPAAHWRNAGELDPHGTSYDCERASLCMGNLTDDELANAAYLNYDVRPAPQDIIAGKAHSPIAYMTAVKERIRWLSRRLYEATNPVNEGWTPAAEASTQLQAYEQVWVAFSFEDAPEALTQGYAIWTGDDWGFDLSTDGNLITRQQALDLGHRTATVHFYRPLPKLPNTRI